MLHKIGSTLLILGLLGSCEDDRDQSQSGSCVTQRCYWNPETQAFDRNCVLVDAAVCPRDTGQDGGQR
jgi:hypothetical protein